MNSKQKFSGTLNEIALKQGQFFKSQTDDLLHALSMAPFLPSKLQAMIPLWGYKSFLKKIGKKYFKLHHTALESTFKRDLTADFKNLAQGLGLPIEFLYGMNSFEILSSDLPFSLGCSSLSFPENLIATNEPVIAYNHDFPESFKKFLFVKEQRALDAYDSLILTYPTILGGIAGVNEKGLAVTLNHAFATDIIDHPAVPITCLVGEILNQCANAGEVEHFVKDVPVPNGSMITVSDETGDRLVVELSCQRKVIRRSTPKEVQYTFNFYQEHKTKEVEIPAEAVSKGLVKLLLKDRKYHQHNKERFSRFKEIYDSQRIYDENDLQKILSDHGQTPGGAFDTICRHDEISMNTIASAMIFPKSRELKVIFGRACEGTYQSFVLSNSDSSKQVVA